MYTLSQAIFYNIVLLLFCSQLYAETVKYDFESSSYTQLISYLTPYNETEKATYAFQKVNKPVRAGCYSARFEVRKGDCGYRKDCDGYGDIMNRAELSEETFYLPRGESSYYGFSILISNEIADTEDWRLLTQWHSKPGENVGEIWLNPILACRYTGGDIIFTKSYHTNDYIYVKNEIIHRINGIEKDKWHDFVVHLVWSPDANGLVEVWRGSNMEFSKSGNIGFDHHGEGVYWKFGLYRTEVEDLRDVVYFDELRRGVSRLEVIPRDEDCAPSVTLNGSLLLLLQNGEDVPNISRPY